MSDNLKNKADEMQEIAKQRENVSVAETVNPEEQRKIAETEKLKSDADFVEKEECFTQGGKRKKEAGCRKQKAAGEKNG